MEPTDIATIDEPYRATVNLDHSGRGSALKHICIFCMQTAPSDKFNDLQRSRTRTKRLQNWQPPQ